MKVLGSLPILDIYSTKARVMIENNNLTLHVNSIPAKMQVTRQAPRMKVNRAQSSADTGMRNYTPSKLKLYHLYNSDYYAGDGLPTLDEISEQGLSALQDDSQDKDSAMPTDNVQKEKSLPDTGLSAIPSTSLDVEWEKGVMDIEWTRHSMEMSWEGEVYPDITVTPYSVEIRVLNGREVRLSVDEERIYPGAGKVVDKEL